MRKQYRAELAQISPTETREAMRARIDAEPAQPRQPCLRVGSRVWFIDAGHWFELEVVEKSGSKGRRVTFKSVTGWDDKHEVEWGLGTLFEFPVHSPLFQRLRHISTRRP